MIDQRMNTRLEKTVLKIFAVGLLVGTTLNTDASPLVTVCQLIRNPEKWENKIVKVRGALEIRKLRSAGFRNRVRPDGTGFPMSLLPLTPELCRYSNSRYTSATESAEIDVALPEFHIRVKPPAGFHIDDASLESASTQLLRIREYNPFARWATVVVEGILTVRKYNVIEIQQRAREKETRGLTDWTAPIILVAWSFQSIEAPPFLYERR
jgi:hypothetical protein